MNREITTKRIKGKGVCYTNPCPETKGNETEVFVGNPRFCNSTCPWFRKIFTNKEGKRVVHCEAPLKP